MYCCIFQEKKFGCCTSVELFVCLFVYLFIIIIIIFFLGGDLFLVGPVGKTDRVSCCIQFSE